MVAVLLYLDGVGNTSIRDKNVRGTAWMVYGSYL